MTGTPARGARPWREFYPLDDIERRREGSKVITPQCNRSGV